MQFHKKQIELSFNVSQLDDTKWKDSTFGIHGSGGQRGYDQAFRLSQQYFLEIPGTNDGERYGAPTQWKALRYDHGHFIRHKDRQTHPRQIGVQILLPPKCQCLYRGGELVAFEGGQEIIVMPHPYQWSVVYMPLGTEHEVRPVKGIRYSFTRPIYGEKEFSYDPLAPSN